jgi:hypothetical protein
MNSSCASGRDNHSVCSYIVTWSCTRRMSLITQANQSRFLENQASVLFLHVAALLRTVLIIFALMDANQEH